MQDQPGQEQADIAKESLAECERCRDSLLALAESMGIADRRDVQLGAEFLARAEGGFRAIAKGIAARTLDGVTWASLSGRNGAFLEAGTSILNAINEESAEQHGDGD